MDKKIIESRLLRNPKYSSAWVETAAKILTSSNTFTEEKLAEFNAEQLEIINAAIEYNEKAAEDARASIMDIANPELNATQMRLILAGQQNKIPIAFLKTVVSKDIPYATSNYIVQAAVDGYDMAKYVKGYNNDQVYEIYAGVHNNVDINVYDKPEINADIMGLVRHALEIDKAVSIDMESGKVTIDF